MSVKNRNSVKNQHYVPCCVLNYFKESDIISRNKETRIYHFLNEKGQIYPTTVNKAMYAEDFYEHEKLTRNYLEKALENFEGVYSSLQRILIDSIMKYKNKDIKLIQLKNLVFNNIGAFFVMRFRSGAMLYEQTYSHPTNGVYGIADKLFLDKGYIHSIIHTLQNFYDFCILESNNSNFLISDQFVSTASLSFKATWMNSTNRSIGLNNVLILIPISKAYYICFWNSTGSRKPVFLQADKINKLTKQQTLEINKVIINNSYIQTVGPSRESLQSVINFFHLVYPHSTYIDWGEYKPGRFHGADLGKEVFYYDSDLGVYQAIRHRLGLYKAHNNDLCPCGSGEVFKKCCKYKLKAFKKLNTDVSDELISRKAMIPGCRFVEKPIFQW